MGASHADRMRIAELEAAIRTLSEALRSSETELAAAHARIADLEERLIRIVEGVAMREMGIE